MNERLKILEKTPLILFESVNPKTAIELKQIREGIAFSVFIAGDSNSAETLREKAIKIQSKRLVEQVEHFLKGGESNE